MAEYSIKAVKRFLNGVREKISRLVKKESKNILEQYLGAMGIIAVKDLLEEGRELKKKIS